MKKLDWSSRSPEAFRVDIGGWLKVVVARSVHAAKDDWVVWTHPALFPDTVLHSKELEKAKAEALQLVCQKLEGALGELR